MSETSISKTSTSKISGPDAAVLPERAQLSFDLNVDIAVVGAGLTVALEVALEVSNVEVGDLICRLQTLGEDFETAVEGWQVDRVRAELKTDHYFHGVYYPEAFQIDSRKYLHGLAVMAQQAG